MAGEEVVAYAKLLASAIYPAQAADILAVSNLASAQAFFASDPDAGALLTPAFALEEALVTQDEAKYYNAIAQWKAARDAIQDQILNVLAAPLAAIPPLRDLIRSSDLNTRRPPATRAGLDWCVACHLDAIRHNMRVFVRYEVRSGA